MINSNITRVIAEKVDELHELIIEYDNLPVDTMLYERNEALERLCIKVELVVSLHIKALHSLDMIAKSGDYMFRSDISDSAKELREYLKSFTSMAWNYAEILRNNRIKLEYQLELSKSNLQKEKGEQ